MNDRSEDPSKSAPSDLAVESISDALEGFEVDFVVSGSIAAVETVKSLRALRRLGASVTPYLTQGGSQFVTALSLAWASAQTTQTEFTGGASHLGFKDACVVAPASAGFISKLEAKSANGVCETLVSSYLGEGCPVFMLPTMHGSLVHGYDVEGALERLQKKFPNLHLLDHRKDETSVDADKKKYPSPTSIANTVAHHLRKRSESVMINMGGTCSYMDPVRFIGNVSTGRTGSKVAEELYRQGFETKVLAARANFLPENYGGLWRCQTNSKMIEVLASIEYDHAVCMAAIADYEFESQLENKQKSSSDTLELKLVKSKKILSLIQPKSGKKVGFKLENFKNPDEKKELLETYLEKYGITSMVLNNASMEWDKVRAYALDASSSEYRPLPDTAAMSEYITEHFS